MKGHSIKSFTLTLAALVLVLAQPSGSSVVGQRRKAVRRAPAATRTKPVVNYSRFSHSTKAHQENCKTCHEAPTSNWRKVREFPDVADYPGHDACVRCHRPQFFKGVQPPICTICHTKVSPRHDARFPFPNRGQPEQFSIEFPHDKHQDVIALMSVRPAPGSRVRVSLKSAHAVFQEKVYNTCAICHRPNTKPPVPQTAGWVDGFIPTADAFKAVPEQHDACFNCHWKGQEPVKDNCAGCHKPVGTPELPEGAPIRISMKFSHEGGGEKKIHVAECTSCHINITKATTLSGLKPDVPIASCATSSCHNSPKTHEEVATELARLGKDKQFICSYCHTSNVGKLDPPTSHNLAVEAAPVRRKDLK